MDQNKIYFLAVTDDPCADTIACSTSFSLEFCHNIL